MKITDLEKKPVELEAVKLGRCDICWKTTATSAYIGCTEYNLCYICKEMLDCFEGNLTGVDMLQAIKIMVDIAMTRVDEDINDANYDNRK